MARAAIGDVDGDGKLDVVLTGGGKVAQFCPGDGTGQFTCSAMDTSTDTTLAAIGRFGPTP